MIVIYEEALSLSLSSLSLSLSFTRTNTHTQGYVTKISVGDCTNDVPVGDVVSVICEEARVLSLSHTHTHTHTHTHKRA